MASGCRNHRCRQPAFQAWQHPAATCARPPTGQQTGWALTAAWRTRSQQTGWVQGVPTWARAWPPAAAGWALVGQVPPSPTPLPNEQPPTPMERRRMRRRIRFGRGGRGWEKGSLGGLGGRLGKGRGGGRANPSWGVGNTTPFPGPQSPVFPLPPPCPLSGVGPRHFRAVSGPSNAFLKISHAYLRIFS